MDIIGKAVLRLYLGVDLEHHPVFHMTQVQLSPPTSSSIKKFF